MSARSLNKVMLIGNLTRDPELRYTPSGTAVCTFGLATNRSWTPSDGSAPQEETEFHRIVAWSKLAEICSQLLNKGRKVYCEGRLQTRKWTGQDGQERTTTEVVIDEMIALGAPKNSSGGYSNDDYDDSYSSTPADSSGQDSGGDDPAQAPSNDNSSSKASNQQDEDQVDVDDIPF